MVAHLRAKQSGRCLMQAIINKYMGITGTHQWESLVDRTSSKTAWLWNFRFQVHQTVAIQRWEVVSLAIILLNVKLDLNHHHWGPRMLEKGKSSHELTVVYQFIPEFTILP